MGIIEERNEKTLELTLFESCRRRRMLIRFGLSLLVPILLFAACEAMYRIAISDILIKDTLWPRLISEAQIILDYAFYWLAFAFALYGFYRFEKKNSIAFFVLYALLVVVRCLANLLAVYLVMGFPLARYFLTDLLYVLSDILLDLVMMAVFAWILYAFKRRNENPSQKRNGAYLLSKLPFEGLFALRNPVLRALVWGGVIAAAKQFLLRLIMDLQIGFPESLPNLLWMLVSYLSDYLYILIGYLVMLLLVNRFFMSEEKAAIESEENASIESESI